VLATAAALAISAGTAAAAAPRARVGSVPALPHAARLGGRLAPSARVDLTVSLTGRDPLGLQRLAQAVSTPGSPDYRHYLSVRRFADRFGATAAQIAAVTRTLRAAGLSVSPVSANHMMLGVSGTAAAVQDAFATRLDAVRTAGGRSAYADRRAPTLPASIAPSVDAVIGLDTLDRPQADQVAPEARPLAEPLSGRSVADVATGGPQPCAAATGTSANPQIGGYTADEIQAAYNFSGLYAAGDFGAGQSVAVYELEKVHTRDLAAYQACYGTRARISYVDTGHPTFGADDAEAALDIEQIIGLAPSVHVIVYQAADNFTAGVKQFNKIVSQNRARTVSISWGLCEAKITFGHRDLSIVRSEAKIFQEAAVQGQSVLAASGDTGSAGCQNELGSSRLAVQDPASQPFVTGVGGTTLYTEYNGQPALWNPNLVGEPLLQAVWNDGELKTSHGVQAAATTGGLSSLWAMPRYQRRAAPGLGVVNSDSSGKPCHSSRKCREIPDVSADGDPATGYVVYASAGSDHTWTSEGGTSAAAPLWAALTAEADALPACRGASLGFENPAIYKLAGTTPDFSDVTAANPLTGAPDNDAVGKNHGLYPVTSGYDMTTGIGTPNAASVAVGLCELRAPVYTVSIVAPDHHYVLLHHRVRLRFNGSDSGGRRLRFSARHLPRGLRISRRGVLHGRPRKAGRYHIRITAKDSATNRARISFRLVVLRHRRHHHHRAAR
jgi:subtilase family serine protease